MVLPLEMGALHSLLFESRTVLTRVADAQGWRNLNVDEVRLCAITL